MGAFYELPIPADTGVDEPQDLWEILAPAARSVRLWGIDISQGTATTSELWNITISRVTGSPTSGSGGSTITPVAASQLSGSSGLTVERNNTTLLTGGTIATFDDRWVQLVQGHFYQYVPPTVQHVREISGAERFLIRLVTDPATARTVSGNVIVEVCG